MLNIIKGVSYRAGHSLAAAFSGYNLWWHVAAILLTYLLVHFGFDWWYFLRFGHGATLYAALPAALIGFFIPILVPFILLVKGRRNSRTLNTAYAMAQAEIWAWFVIACYKFITGRAHPEIFVKPTHDLSRIFHFGLGKEGIFWGWPSTHTAVAFAASACLLVLYPESKRVRYIAVLYAFYIGLGVSVSIHWFSDFVAGAIVGSVIGLTVARTFKTRLAKLTTVSSVKNP